MRVQEVPLEQAVGQLLLHSVFDTAGKRVIRKGVTLTEAHLAQLRSLGQSSIEVAVLEEGDVGEERAAAQLIEILCTDALVISWGIGGRANLHTTLSGVVYVDVARLEELNTLAGVTLATVPQYSVVHPRFRTETSHPRKGDQVAP
jgi:molybdenum cofactor cytidylyltransferase